MQELLSLLGLGGGGLLTKAAYDKMGDVGDQAVGQSQDIANTAIGMNDFQGYGVTGPVGSSSVDAMGNTTQQLSDGQQRYSDMNALGSVGMMQRALGDTTQRENDIYSKIRAMQEPGERRAQMGLNEQLLNQGRAGVRSNLYGGTPEQLAMSKANAEARNTAAYGAIDSARAQQGQDAELSRMFGEQQYAPMEQLRRDSMLGQQNYGLKDINSRQNANIYAEAAMGGLDAQLAASLGQGNLMGNLGSSLIDGGMGMLGSAVNSGVNNVGDFLGQAYDSLFG